jgi:hypothetical protein
MSTLVSGLLLLCQQHYCDELSTPSLASTSVASVTNDSATSTTFRPPLNTSTTATNETKTSVISTSTTHTTRLHRISVTPNDIDVTTSVESLCAAKSYDSADDDNYSIKSISGDIIVTVILRRADNATEIIKFIVNHINEIDLLVHNVSIGE